MLLPIESEGFRILLMPWLLLPPAWFYFRFDRRDPKFTGSILSD